ncbi:MAG: glycogen/starch synthase, partial [Thermococcus sp.]
MRVLILSFEYLPVKVGGLAEAVTNVAEGLAEGNEVIVFTPDHGRSLGEPFLTFRLSFEGRTVEITARKWEQNGVTVYTLSGDLLDTDVYPDWETLLRKAVLFGKASAGLLNHLIETFRP